MPALHKDFIGAILEEPTQINPLRCGKVQRSINTIARLFLQSIVISLGFYYFGAAQAWRSTLLAVGGLVVVVVWSQYADADVKSKSDNGAATVDDAALSELVERFENLHQESGAKGMKENEYSKGERGGLMNEPAVMEGFMSSPVVEGTSEHERLYGNLDDVFGREASQRQFVTIPTAGQVPGDTVALARWLQKDATNCKDRNRDCQRGQ